MCAARTVSGGALKMSRGARASKKSVPTTPGARRARPKRSEQSTATAVRAGPKEKEPPLFDPFQDGAPPLQPEDFFSEHRHDGKMLEFKYDDFLTKRRVARRNVHGDIETRFDPESLVPSDSYLRNVADSNMLEQVDVDEAVERERLAGIVEQPREVQEQLRADLRNPKFLSAITKTVVRSKKGAARAAPEAPSAAPVRIETATGAADDPDFFTHVEAFDGIDVLRQRMRKRRRERRFEALQAQEADDDDDDDDGEVESERESSAESVSRDESDDDEAERVYSALLSDAQARDLVQCNPFSSLRIAARCDLMRLADVAAVYRLLSALTMRHEEHRAHVNVVELVRELAVRGAKYDGCVQVRSKRRLGALLERGFYESFYSDETSDRLLGGHEHYLPTSHTTRFCVFKFYLVQRNAANCALLQVVDETSRREERASGGATRLNVGGAYDVDQRRDENDDADAFGSMHNIADLPREFMLCLRVVCVECCEDVKDTHDSDAGASDLEASGDEESRGSGDDGGESCGSVADDDFEVLPEFEPRRLRQWRAEAHSRSTTSETSGATAGAGGGASRRGDLSSVVVDEFASASGTIAPDGLLSSESSTSHVRSVEIEASASHLSNSSSARARTPSSLSVLDRLLDDDDDESESESDATLASALASDESEQSDTDMVLGDRDAMPTNHVMLNHKRASHLVGKPRAAAFLQRVNGRSIGVLCVRAFKFYAVDAAQK